MKRANRTASEQRAHLAREIFEVFLFVALIFIIVNVAVQSFIIPDVTMAPLLQPNQYVLVNKAAYFFGGPSRGDIVLVANPQNPSQKLIRRVIAGPGDTITINAQHVIVNGAILNEPYVPAGEAGSESIVNQKLGSNQYFVLCDARLSNDQSDSRGFGAVPRANILGKAVMVFWPTSVIHWLA
ncbi:MAG: signal peptidase I [Ktedonobacterales bacterium]